ncbi:hypothetical protein VNO77_39284 [Canavalia gladiata]|uniref:Uncharacterized protein n=1 Tax=Canavalia gladiata TaxID=3824 RepID=A0AAN9PVP0_CANGL
MRGAERILSNWELSGSEAECSRGRSLHFLIRSHRNLKKGKASKTQRVFQSHLPLHSPILGKFKSILMILRLFESKSKHPIHDAIEEVVTVISSQGNRFFGPRCIQDSGQSVDLWTSKILLAAILSENSSPGPDLNQRTKVRYCLMVGMILFLKGVSRCQLKQLDDTAEVVPSS